VSKKPVGYDIVMLDADAKLVDATKLIVTGTFDFLATLSDGAITKDAIVTCPPMLPELTPALAKSSVVCTDTPVGDPAFGPPSVQPVKVNV
jgi:hypothetical protein